MNQKKVDTRLKKVDEKIYVLGKIIYSNIIFRR